MQPDISALHSVRASEGDIFSLVRPCDFVAEPLHLPYKIRTIAAAVHHKINIGHQLELPAVALCRSTVLTARNICAVFFIRFENAQPVLLTDAVAECAQFCKRAGALAEFPSVFVMHGVE